MKDLTKEHIDIIESVVSKVLGDYPASVQQAIDFGIEPKHLGSYGDAYKYVCDKFTKNEEYDFKTYCMTFSPEKRSELIRVFMIGPTIKVTFFLAELKEIYESSVIINAISKCNEKLSSRRPNVDVNGFSEKVRAELAQDLTAFIDPNKGLSKKPDEWALKFQTYLEKVIEGSEESSFMTGVSVIDKNCYGAVPGKYYVITARTSVGKTTLACYIANTLQRNGAKPLFITIEMDSNQIASILASIESGVSFSKIRTKSYKGTELDRYVDALRMHYKGNICINDSLYGDFDKLELEVRKLVRQQRCNVVIIDYIQQFRLNTRFDSRHAEISEISRRLQIITKELSIPVFALAQLNRGAVNNSNKGPFGSLAFIKDSGAIEQDADVVINLSRPEEDDEEEEDTGKRVITVAKNKMGKVGSKIINMDLTTGRFYD